jgi:hypothetical protein
MLALNVANYYDWVTELLYPIFHHDMGALVYYRWSQEGPRMPMHEAVSTRNLDQTRHARSG